MKLYYSPGACSLAPHIVLHESGANHTADKVNLRSHTYDGGDFYKVNPKGSVPTLQLADGQLLTEAAVIMQYLADQKPDTGLMPRAGTFERYRAQEWLNYIASELHKGFSPLWSPTTPEEYKAQVKETLGKKFAYLSEHLKNNQYLMGAKFTVADAYLFTILNWSNFLKLDMTPWPTLLAYMERVKSRPGVQAALKMEGLLQ